MLNDMESIIPNFVFFIITMKNIGRKKAIHHTVLSGIEWLYWPRWQIGKSGRKVRRLQYRPDERYWWPGIGFWQWRWRGELDGF